MNNYSIDEIKVLSDEELEGVLAAQFRGADLPLARDANLMYIVEESLKGPFKTHYIQLLAEITLDKFFLEDLTSQELFQLVHASTRQKAEAILYMTAIQEQQHRFHIAKVLEASGYKVTPELVGTVLSAIKDCDTEGQFIQIMLKEVMQPAHNPEFENLDALETCTHYNELRDNLLAYEETEMPSL